MAPVGVTSATARSNSAYINEAHSNDDSCQNPIPFPVVGGINAIGRVGPVSPDAADLKVGDFVVMILRFARVTMPAKIMLLAFLTPTGETQTLAKDAWHHSA